MFMANLLKGCGTPMSSFLNVTLDTTKPCIEVYTPEYASIGSDMEVVIIADETLDNYQDIYILHNNKKTQLTFLQKKNKLKGIIPLNDIKEGNMEIHVQLRDEVYNLSEKIVKNIVILENKGLILNDKITSQNIDCKLKTNHINNGVYYFENKIDTKVQNTIDSLTTMNQNINMLKLK